MPIIEYNCVLIRENSSFWRVWRQTKQFDSRAFAYIFQAKSSQDYVVLPAEMHCSRFALFFDPVYFSSLHSKKASAWGNTGSLKSVPALEREGSRFSLSPLFSLYICNKGYKRRQLYDWLNSQRAFIFRMILFKFQERHLPLRNFFTQYVSSCLLVFSFMFDNRFWILIEILNYSPYQKFRINIQILYVCTYVIMFLEIAWYCMLFKHLFYIR